MPLIVYLLLQRNVTSHVYMETVLGETIAHVTLAGKVHSVIKV